jgi:hypothetical protein
MKKRLIRNSVWETNSSSSHSIALADKNKQFILDTIYPNQHGIIYVNGGEYGWEWVKYNDAITKLSYAYQSMVDIELLKRVVMNQTGATDVIFNEKSMEEGYVDHQSYGTANEVCTNDEDARNFIFNKNSWLFTGNDNGTPDPTFYHVPEFKDGKMIVPEYKYELSIEGVKKTTKFLKKPKTEDIRDAVSALTDGLLMNSNGYVNDDDSIFFQIQRQRNWFEKSYHVEQDYSKGYLVLSMEGCIHDLEKRLYEEGIINKEMNWRDRGKIVTEELLKDESISKKLKITITKIKK